MNEVRFGIVGVGNMGSGHARSLMDGKVPRGVLTAICDQNPQTPARFPGIKAFTTIEALIESQLVDAVVVATPHYFHTPNCVAALNAGLHVMVEKPLSVHKADCERLLAAHKPGKQIFGEMFNQRTDPLYQKLRNLIHEGELGQLRRVQWTVTDWFRTQAYYDSGGWRATWAGEGGGVLLNQSPHNLDLWQWLFGMPDRVRGHAKMGRYHDIEVEDDVTAYFEYQDGMTGTFITSTGEAPGTNRLEVVAERGKVVIEGGRLTFTRNEMPMSKFSKTTMQSFGSPATWEVNIPIEGRGTQHVGVLINFVEAILDGATLLTPAADGINSVELANAILLSSSENETISLPLDGARYEAWLAQKVAQSKVKAQVHSVRAADFAKSLK